MAAQKEDVDETSSEKDVISKPENFTTTLGEPVTKFAKNLV